MMTSRSSCYLARYHIHPLLTQLTQVQHAQLPSSEQLPPLGPMLAVLYIVGHDTDNQYFLPLIHTGTATDSVH